MKTLNIRQITLLFMTVASISAVASTREEIARVEGSVSPVFNTKPGSLAWNGIYKFSADTQLTPLQEFIGQRETGDGSRPSLGFNAGEPVAVEFLPNNQVSISLLPDESEKGQVPDRIIVSRSEFERSGLELKGRGGAKELAEQFDVDDPTQVARRGGGGTRKRHRAHARGMGGCVLYVSNKLGGIPLPDGRNVVTALINRGLYRPAKCSSPSPKMIASWSGGDHGRGHTAIWQGGWCYDLNCKLPGSKYHGMHCAVPR
jgi:hypothetical protein